MTLIAAILLACVALMLTLAWHSGAQVFAEHQRYRTFSGHVDAKIVESWLALEIDRSSIKVPANWRASAMATPCVVVEIQRKLPGVLLPTLCRELSVYGDCSS